MTSAIEICNITDRLYWNVLKKPTAAALTFGNGPVLNYLQVWRKASAMREQLRKQGLKKGARVAIFVSLRLEVILLIIALFAEGITPVLIDPRLKKKYWLQCLGQSEPDAIITSGGLYPLAKLIKFSSKHFLKTRLLRLSSLLQKDTDAVWKPVRTEAEHINLISLTSGTTGFPKQISRSFRVLLRQQSLASKYLPPLAEDRHLTVYGMAALQGLVDGAFMVLAKDSSLEVLQGLVQKHQIQRVSGPPSFFCKLLQLDTERADSLSCLLTGSAPVPRWLFSKLQNKFRNAQVWNIYGSTECEPICLTQQNPSSARPGYFVGAMVNELEMLKLDPFTFSGHECFEVGLRGENLASPNQNFATGDLATIDPDGQLYLLGRKTEMIRRIPIAFLEEPLEGVAGIRRLAFIEKDDKIHAFVERETPQVRCEDELRQHLQQYGLQIDSLSYKEKLPVDARHQWKIQRRDLLAECP